MRACEWQPPGLYVLAGVVVRPEQAEQVRDVLRSKLRHQRRPFHWRQEERTDRESMAKRVGALNLSAGGGGRLPGRRAPP